MSKKKSLGSSPIGYSALSSGTSSYQFIPDLGVSSSHSSTSSDTVSKMELKSNRDNYAKENSGSDNAEKKIASYYIEVSIIERLKNMADDQGSYYSSVASDAIHHWVSLHGY